VKAAKRRIESVQKVDRTRRYALNEACDLVKQTGFASFDESVDLAVRLGVNPKHADQMVRGAIVLPHGIGKVKRVLVFAKGEKASEAEQAGADHVGADELVKKVGDGFFDFDTAISTPVDLSNAHRIDAGHFAGSQEAFRHWDEDGEVEAGCAKCHSAAGLPRR